MATAGKFSAPQPYPLSLSVRAKRKCLWVEPEAALKRRLPCAAGVSNGGEVSPSSSPRTRRLTAAQVTGGEDLMRGAACTLSHGLPS